MNILYDYILDISLFLSASTLFLSLGAPLMSRIPPPGRWSAAQPRASDRFPTPQTLNPKPQILNPKP